MNTTKAKIKGRLFQEVLKASKKKIPTRKIRNAVGEKNIHIEARLENIGLSQYHIKLILQNVWEWFLEREAEYDTYKYLSPEEFVKLL